MLVCLLCSISRKLGKAIELEAIKPTHQVLSVHEKKKKSVSQIYLKARFLSLTQGVKGDESDASFQEFVIKRNKSSRFMCRDVC